MPCATTDTIVLQQPVCANVTVTFDPEHYSEVLPMMTVPTEESIYQQCALGSDSDTGGYSTATLTYHQENGMPFMRFKGNLSLHVPPDSRKKGMTHSGWAGWRTKPMGATLFNRYQSAPPKPISPLLLSNFYVRVRSVIDRG